MSYRNDLRLFLHYVIRGPIVAKEETDKHGLAHTILFADATAWRTPENEYLINGYDAHWIEMTQNKAQ
jgi:hypothetical protein